VTWQEAWPVVPVPASVHDAVGLNDPPGVLEANFTVPDGVLFVPELVSDTVAVHVVGLSTGTEVGEHATAVNVDRPVTVKLN
jgi:hypothetical protein